MEGDDTISELAGNDIVEGGAGNDYIYAGAGDDIIDGDDTDSGTTNGTSDTLDFTLISINDDSGDTRDVDGTGSDTTTVDAYNGIEIDLSLTSAQRIHAEYGTDTITNIENVIGSNKNDYIQWLTEQEGLESNNFEERRITRSTRNKKKTILEENNFASSSFRSIVFYLFLPDGYFHNRLAPEYLTFQVYDTLQALCSYLRGVLCTRAVLIGMGVSFHCLIDFVLIWFFSCLFLGWK